MRDSPTASPFFLFGGFTVPSLVIFGWFNRTGIQVGEYTAAVVAGTMSLEDGLRLAARLGLLAKGCISKPLCFKMGFLKTGDSRPLL